MSTKRSNNLIPQQNQRKWVRKDQKSAGQQPPTNNSTSLLQQILDPDMQNSNNSLLMDKISGRDKHPSSNSLFQGSNKSINSNSTNKKPANNAIAEILAITGPGSKRSNATTNKSGNSNAQKKRGKNLEIASAATNTSSFVTAQATPQGSPNNGSGKRT